jgi:hypothetical protein
MHAADTLMGEDKDRRKVERYDTPRAHEAIRRMAELAIWANIDPRDIPRLFSLHSEGRF